MGQSDADTLRALETSDNERPEQPALVCLSIVYHPDPSRVGERALVLRQESGRPVRLSRNELEFANPASERDALALSDPYLSRASIELVATKEHLSLGIPARAGVKIDGVKSEGRVELDDDRLDRGVLLELQKRVVLLAHFAEVGARPDEYGLSGESRAIRAVRRAISRVADLDAPVLIRGETGVGKEHVAQAIHRASGRTGACLAVNVATLAPTLAASELFGHVKGAFTGANERRVGLFERANGGTLLLDEVGELASDVQPMLLRALESGSVRAVGDHEERAVNARVIAATDSDLEHAVEGGTFRAALYHRLRGFEITVPPLRERRDDIAPLIVELAREELARTGEQDRLVARGPDAAPWIDRTLLLRLVRHDWPGNVRELRGVVRQLVVSSRGEPTLRADAALERTLVARAESEKDRRAADIPRPEVVAALREHRWSIGKAARALGITRSALYRLTESDPEIRRGSELDKDELENLLREHDGNLESVAETLHVSPRALRLRLRALGLI